MKRTLAQTIRRAALGTAMACVAATWLTVAPPVLTRGAAGAEAAEAPEVGLVRAFTAAWNARDAEAVAALLAASAQVRQRNARVVRHGANVDVSDVYGSELTYEGDPPRFDADEVVWATGESEIRDWLARFLPAGQHVEVTRYGVVGDTVTWSYRVPPPPHVRRAVPGMPATTGSAAARVVGGEIVQLTLTSAPAVAARRAEALAHALEATLAGYDRDQLSEHPHAGAPPPNTQARTTPSPAAGVVAALACLAATACLAAVAKP